VLHALRQRVPASRTMCAVATSNSLQRMLVRPRVQPFDMAGVLQRWQAKLEQQRSSGAMRACGAVGTRLARPTGWADFAAYERGSTRWCETPA